MTGGPFDTPRSIAMTRTILSSLALAFAIALGACGSDPKITTPTPTPTPPPPAPVTVSRGDLTPQAHHFYDLPITTTVAGTLSVQVNWTFSSDVMLVAIATPSCTVAAFQGNACSFLVIDSGPTTTPSKTVTLPGAAVGSYVVIIDNRGPADESLNYVVALLPSAG
jgi:hypothetical protein